MFPDIRASVRMSRLYAARQRGFTIVAAIFLLMLLGALGALMLTLSTTQNVTSTFDLQGAKAYQAANAGLEWGVFQIMNPENSNTLLTPKTPYACPGSATSITTLGGSLSGFSVSVLCTSVTNTEGTNTIRTYTLTSTATWAGAAAVERELVATVVTCRQTDSTNC
jgi:MSHA biogenesis protein MshP